MVDLVKFSVNEQETGLARAELLQEAGDKLDERHTLMSGEDEPGASHEGDLVRALSEDVARLQMPEVLPLDTTRLVNDAPVELSELLDRYRFYWLQFPVELRARKGWGFNELEAIVSFNASEPEAQRPRTHGILPDQKFQTKLEASSEVRLGGGADLRFTAGLPSIPLAELTGLPLEAKADAGVDAGGDFKFKFRPFDYSVRVAMIEHSNLGLDYADWTLRQAQLIEEDDRGLRVILKVPRDAPERLEVCGLVRARRYFNTLEAGVREAIKSLPERFIDFFTNGAAMAGPQQSWDLTGQLTAGRQPDAAP